MVARDSLGMRWPITVGCLVCRSDSMSSLRQRKQSDIPRFRVSLLFSEGWDGILRLQSSCKEGVRKGTLDQFILVATDSAVCLADVAEHPGSRSVTARVWSWPWMAPKANQNVSRRPCYATMWLCCFTPAANASQFYHLAASIWVSGEHDAHEQNLILLLTIHNRSICPSCFKLRYDKNIHCNFCTILTIPCWQQGFVVGRRRWAA